jgi:hypothetical protein
MKKMAVKTIYYNFFLDGEVFNLVYVNVDKHWILAFRKIKSWAWTYELSLLEGSLKRGEV